ncbi:uncharacterized protein LOC144680288 [Cetorhinus maximus]
MISIPASAVASTSFQVPPFLFGCSNETGNNHVSAGMFGSSVAFCSAFGQTGSTLMSTPFNTGVANAGITSNPSSFQSTEAGFRFSGNLVPNCNFGCPTNNTVFQFGANDPDPSTSQGSLHSTPINTSRAPGQPDTVQSSGCSHRKVKSAVFRRK